MFTLANNFLRWTYFGPTRFIHPWTTLVHATLLVSDVIDKCNIWLADVTFDWRHDGLYLFFAAYLQDLNQNLTNSDKKDLKTKYKYKKWISFFWGSWKYERNGSRLKLTWRPSGNFLLHVTRCVHTSMNLTKNEIYFLTNFMRIK